MKYFLTLFLLGFGNVIYAQNVGIGTSSPNASARLDITDTARGILIPRMNKLQRDAIVSPAEGLMIYQIDNDKGYYYYSGSQWQAIAPNSNGDARMKTQFYISNL